MKLFIHFYFYFYFLFLSSASLTVFSFLVDLLWFIWDDAEDTPLFDWIGETFVDELEGFARSVGGDSPFVYLNYAAKSQDPLKGYGEENLAFLKAVAEKHDPLGVFQTQVPGGFKVSRA